MTEVSEATALDLIAAINRLCDIIDKRKKEVPINGTKRSPKDHTGAERARRYRDRVKYRATNGNGLPEAFGIRSVD